MSQEQAQAQAAQEQPTLEVRMPSTPEELRVFCATAMNDILTIPENTTMIAAVVLGTALKALQDKRQVESRAALRPALVRVYYPGAIKAVVLAKEQEEGDSQLKVEFTLRGKDGEWIDTGIEPAKLDRLAQLVLSQSTVPGDVWYVTTTGAVENALQQATELVKEVTEQEPKQEALPEDPVAEVEDQKVLELAQDHDLDPNLGCQMSEQESKGN